uniref:PsbP C-terminal domain-containing protein n=1 Tax=Leersia perrieri TaxID=77586 RepID=A0A0D9WGB1_9ORYZ
MAPAVLLRLAPSPPPPKPPRRRPLCRCGASRREFAVHTAIASASAAAAVRPATAEEAPTTTPPPPPASSKKGSSSSPVLGGIANTRSWSQYYGSGFSIRVPPSFDDILEPEEFNVGMTYYGDKAKPRTYAARFASPDRSELVSVVIKPSNQLKITFLEAKDITDLGTLKEASKIFVPAGAKLYSARIIKVKDEDDIRTYYFYEFGLDKEHVAVMATVNSGKTYIAGATAPETKWDDDGVKLRSAAVSMSVS